MKRSAVTIIASVFAVALSLSPTAVKATSSDEADIRALEDRFAVAVNAKDVNAIMKVYVPDESLLVFDVPHPANMSAPRLIARIGRTSLPPSREHLNLSLPS
jgi:ketosteroid isomerase-like protein